MVKRQEPIGYLEQTITSHNWQDFYAELDIDLLRQQIRDIIEHDYSAKPSSIEWIEAVRNEGLDETTEKILALVFPGITERETDK